MLVVDSEVPTARGLDLGGMELVYWIL